MKVKVINNICCKDIQVGSVLDVIPGLQQDAEDIDAGMCLLCKTKEGKLRYIPVTFLEIIDSSTINWEQVRIQAAIAAMQGFCANPDPKCIVGSSITIARWSVAFADALINEILAK